MAEDTKAAKGGADGKTGDATVEQGRDWGKTLYLPKTDFPMKAGLAQILIPADKAVPAADMPGGR